MDHEQSDWANLCRAIDVAILRALDLKPVADWDDEALIKRADHQALLAEASVLILDEGAGIEQSLASRGVDVSALLPIPNVTSSWTPEEARARFVDTHEQAVASRV